VASPLARPAAASLTDLAAISNVQADVARAYDSTNCGWGGAVCPYGAWDSNDSTSYGAYWDCGAGVTTCTGAIGVAFYVDDDRVARWKLSSLRMKEAATNGADLVRTVVRCGDAGTGDSPDWSGTSSWATLFDQGPSASEAELTTSLTGTVGSSCAITAGRRWIGFQLRGTVGQGNAWFVRSWEIRGDADVPVTQPVVSGTDVAATAAAPAGVTKEYDAPLCGWGGAVCPYGAWDSNDGTSYGAYWDCGAGPPTCTGHIGVAFFAGDDRVTLWQLSSLRLKESATNGINITRSTVRCGDAGTGAHPDWSGALSWPTLYDRGASTADDELIAPLAGTVASACAVSAPGHWIAFQLRGTVTQGYAWFVRSWELRIEPDFGASQPQTFGIDPGLYAYSKDPVNLATGVLSTRAADLTLPGRVLPLAFSRSYNSADGRSGVLGPGWTHSYNWQLFDRGASVEIRRGDGRRDNFVRNTDGTYASPPNVFDVLTKNADFSFTLTLSSQVTYDLATTGPLLRIREPAGNQLTFTYAGGDLTAITDTVGRQVTLTYDTAHRLIQLQDPIGRKVTYAYDGAGRLVTVTDRIGSGAGPAAAHQWQYGYDGATTHLSTITDPDGRVRATSTYDAQGRVTQQRDALAALTTMAYSAGQTVITDPRGHAATYTFDTRMRVLSQSDVVGANTYAISYTYDAAGNRASVSDRNANRTDFTYDARGNLLTKTDPSVAGSRPITTFAYDAKNNLTGITDPLGSLTALTYGPTSNVLLSASRQIDATTNAVTTYAYADPANPGLPTTITSPKGSATTLGYDAQGNLVRRADPDSAITTFAYDGVGRLASFVDPELKTWRVSYDENDRETSRTDPLNNVLRFAYDGAGNRTSSTDRNGNVTSYAYDANTRLVSTQQKPDPVTTYTTSVTRDPNGNATRITQANGVLTDYSFDPLDRLVSVTTHPSAGTDLATTYTLDGNGQPISRTDGAGTTVSYAYDALSRLTAVSGPSLSIGYTYDQASRRTAMTDATGTTTYQYDRLGRITQVAAPAGTLGYAYDLDGNRTGLAYSGGQAVSYAYSPGGRLSSLTDWAGRTSTYAYKPSGLVSSLTFPNGRTSAYSYDDAQRLTSIDTSFGGQSLWRETYTVDAEGNRTRRDDTALGTIPATSTSYGYDGLLRLTSLTRTLTQTGTPLSAETFTLDGATNIASRTGPAASYSYDGANRVTNDGTRAFTYDAADRLTGRGADTFGYDALSRLTSATVNLAGPPASTVVSAVYAYDGDGLLRSRTASGSTSMYVWDTSVGVAQLLQAGSERLVYGLGPLYRVHVDGSYDVLVRDALGSVRAEVSGSGTLTNAFDYTAYGELRAALAGPPTLLGFAGELRDPSGLIYLRARWYDPGVGRFMSKDPIGGAVESPATLDRFTYSGGRPSVLTDPSGLCVDPGGPGIRYCIDRFIPTAYACPFPLPCGTGDARGYQSDGGGFRVRQLIRSDGTVTNQAGVSGLGLFGFPSFQGTLSGCTTMVDPSVIDTTCRGTNGFGLLPAIQTHVLIVETGGRPLIAASGTLYPSLEVWRYGAGGPHLDYFYDARAVGIVDGLQRTGTLPNNAPK